MNRIKHLREELNMTQQELADKLEGAKSTIAMYEKGVSYLALIIISLVEFCQQKLIASFDTNLTLVASSIFLCILILK